MIHEIKIYFWTLLEFLIGTLLYFILLGTMVTAKKSTRIDSRVTGTTIITHAGGLGL